MGKVLAQIIKLYIYETSKMSLLLLSPATE